MKKYKDLGIYDFSDYAEEITGDDGIGLTDKDGNIIHVLREEKSVENYAEYLKPCPKRTVDPIKVISHIGTTATLASEGMNCAIKDSVSSSAINKLSKTSGVLSGVSNITGGILLYNDFKKGHNNPTFKNIMNTISDGAGLVPVIGPASSVVIYGTSESISTIATESLNIQRQFLKRENIMNSFNNMTIQHIFFQT